MSTLLTDKFAGTIRLLVKVTNGKCTMVDGSDLPKMKSDVTAELVISPCDILDDDAREELLKEQRVAFLPNGSSLWARVKEGDIADNLTKFRKTKRYWPGQQALFVQIQLASEVQLVIRGDGRASLGDCVCKIPALPDQECSSINEAYTRVSESFEPSRRSHTGNVFDCVFYELGDYLHPLRKERDEILSAPLPPGPVK